MNFAWNLFSCPVIHNISSTHGQMGTAVAQWLTLNLLTWNIWRVPNNASRWQMGFNSAFKGLRCCATNRKVASSIPASVSEFFIGIKSFRSHYDPGLDSASNRNEYQEDFAGGKSGRCVRLTTLPPSCAFVMKSWNLSFLEPSGPFQACNGTALPFTRSNIQEEVESSSYKKLCFKKT